SPGTNRLVVVRGAVDCPLENGGGRGEPGQCVFGDVGLQDAFVEKPAVDVVEPEALAEVVEVLGRVHGALLRVASVRALRVRSCNHRAEPQRHCARPSRILELYTEGRYEQYLAFLQGRKPAMALAAGFGESRRAVRIGARLRGLRGVHRRRGNTRLRLRGGQGQARQAACAITRLRRRTEPTAT